MKILALLPQTLAWNPIYSNESAIQMTTALRFDQSNDQRWQLELFSPIPSGSEEVKQQHLTSTMNSDSSGVSPSLENRILNS